MDEILACAAAAKRAAQIAHDRHIAARDAFYKAQDEHKQAEYAVTAMCLAPPPHDVMATLPHELVCMIAMYLSPSERQDLAISCKHTWRALGPMPDHLRLKWISIYGGWKRVSSVPAPVQAPDTSITYKTHYGLTVVADGDRNLVVSGTISCARRHPVFPHLIFIVGAHTDLCMWDTRALDTRKDWLTSDGVLSPIYVQGRSLRVHVDDEVWIY